MSIFDGVTMTEAEAMAAMELEQNTRKEVSDMLDGKTLISGAKYVMCKVRDDCKYSSKEYLRVIVSYHRSSLGYISCYIDSEGSSWDYATAINMDGTAMTVYDYNRAR